MEEKAPVKKVFKNAHTFLRGAFLNTFLTGAFSSMIVYSF